MKNKISETWRKLFQGEVTIGKRELWLVGAVCLLAGIVYGLKKAPWTHGVTIGSNNGNNSGNYTDKPKSIEDTQEDCE